MRLGNGEIYYEDQILEYKDDVKNKRCVVCKYKNTHASQEPCGKCDLKKKNNFVSSKIKEA